MIDRVRLAELSRSERVTFAERNATTMLPTEDAEWVGAELARRFGVPRWSFALSPRHPAASSTAQRV